jgi:hypothetical protein
MLYLSLKTSKSLDLQTIVLFINQGKPVLINMVKFDHRIRILLVMYHKMKLIHLLIFTLSLELQLIHHHLVILSQYKFNFDKDCLNY